VTFLKIVLQILVLYVFYFIGKWLQDILDLSIPGSIVGMILLFLCLSCKVVPIKLIEDGSTFLNAYLPVFFIPATIGVMDYFHIFKGSGIVLLIIAMVSTLIVMVLAGKTSQYVLKRKRQSGAKKEDGTC